MRGTSRYDVPPETTRQFSLVVGGPLFQMLMRWRLSNAALGLVQRRMVAAVLILWFPLLFFWLIEAALAGDYSPRFLDQVGIHLRFLVVVPLLIAAELIVHVRLRPIVAQFRVRNLLRRGDAKRFDAYVGEALALRNSVWAEILLLLLVYAVTVPIISQRFALESDAWFVHGGLDAGALSLAGWWLVLVSLPLFQFLLVRWYFRMFIWARFLWRVSRLRLDLDPRHPDRAAGLGFLGGSLSAFLPLATAHGILLAGVIADRILIEGAVLTDFKVQILAAFILVFLVFGGPMLVFTPVLARTRRLGLLSFGALGQAYVRDFRNKWHRHVPPPDEPLLGTGDIQSLADLANSYAVADGMRIVPISRTNFLQFGFAILAPILPLVLTMTSLEELMNMAAGMFV